MLQKHMEVWLGSQCQTDFLFLFSGPWTATSSACFYKFIVSPCIRMMNSFLSYANYMVIFLWGLESLNAYYLTLGLLSHHVGNDLTLNQGMSQKTHRIISNFWIYQFMFKISISYLGVNSIFYGGWLLVITDIARFSFYLTTLPVMCYGKGLDLSEQIIMILAL